tara:strand:- start:2030 stop:2899 length:870 start_codon:yes stop_codon:yes gene_type:complete
MELLMKKLVLTAASLSIAATLSAHAADISTPPMIYDQPVAEQPHYGEMKSAGGWYLRGDLGASWNSLRGIDYAVNGGSNVFVSQKLKSNFSFGAGVGYQVTKRLRSDLTLDYLTKSDFTGSTVGDCAAAAGTGPDCTSRDIASFSAWSLLANTYVDLFTYGRVTGYVGAGLGASYVNWGDLSNTACETALLTNCDATVVHGGSSGWRATAALMAGSSVKITCALSADVGYRYRYIAGGRMFQLAYGAGPGYAEAIHSHEGKAGLRYSFGGCAEHETPAYLTPQLPPVYK